jgi:aspartyl-tRNA(Asn)/glutamyl-tRNA(Gln) amidotransferase subunit A
MIDLSTLTIEKAHAAFTKGEYTSRDLVQAYLDAIKAKNGELHAYLEVFEDALLEADKADQMMKEGKGTMLTGIPFATKDNILIEGKHASASSKILENYVATYDSTVIKLLKEAGAIILGRTNMDEFAMGSSTQTSAYGNTKNPHDTSRVPGGSSGGSAAAVAADMTLVALGTETCGSVRQPAAFCGLVGLKPTYGALSRNGLIAMGNSLDQPAPFTKTVADSEIIFKALSHYDALDSTSVPENMRINPSVSTADTSPSQGRKNSVIGVPRSFFAKGLDPEVEKNFETCLEKLKSGGYSIVDLDMPDLDYSLAVYYIIMPAEVSTNLSRFDGIRYGHSAEGKDLMEVYMKSRGEGFGKEARRRILLGTYVLSHGYYDAYYNKAVLLRDKITRQVNEAFKTVDYILTPTVPTPAFKIGEKMDDPVAMYLCDIFSAPANLAGVPSIALPSGKTEAGLPMSIQFMAPHFREDALFAVGKAFENLR